MEDNIKDTIAQSMGLENAQATTEPPTDVPAGADNTASQQEVQPTTTDNNATQSGDTLTFDEEGNPIIPDSFLESILSDESDEDGEGQQQEPTETQQEPTVAQQTQPQPQQPQLDPNMMVTVKVDGVEQQVPLQEALNGYMRQANYTRKTQELAQERHMLMQQMQNIQQPQQVPQQPQMTQQQRLQQRREQLAKYDAFAKDQVKQMFGEDYNEYDDQHKLAYQDVINQIHQAEQDQFQAQRAAEQQQQQTQQRFYNLYNKYASDPNFDAIDRMAKESLDAMPYNISMEIREAFRTGDTNKIDAYYQAVTDKYYGRNLPPQQQPMVQPQPVPQIANKPKPPFVEPSSSNPGNSKQTINYNALHGMTNDQQAATVSKLMSMGLL